MFRRFLSNRAGSRSPIQSSPLSRRLGVEPLEARDVPSVTLLEMTNNAPLLANQNIPDDKPIFLPISVTNTPNGTVSYQVASNNANLSAQLLTGGRSITFTVTDGATVNGSFTIRLFENVAPLATARLIELANNGFYDNKIFHRVLNNFMIQGGSPNGDGVGGSTLPNYDDEFNSLYTFASPGMVALANEGDDGNNSQFFITDPDLPLTGGAQNRPQHLNFNHSIIGILTDGFAVYQAITQVPVATQPGGSEVSRPVSPITITSAVVSTDTQNTVLMLTPASGFSGAATITVTPSDGDGASSPVSFTVAGVNDNTNSRPFLGAIPANQTATAGQPLTFTVPVTDIDGDPITLDVRDAAFSGLPANVTVSINLATRQVTLTPNANFTGTISLKLGVRDGIDRSGGLGLNNAANFDTQAFTLTVNAAPPVTDPDPGTDPGGESGGGSTPDTPGTETPGTDNPATPAVPITAQASGPGEAPRVTVLNADGSTRFTLSPFEDSFTGGVRVAVADVTGDKQDDVIVVAGSGGAPVLQVYDGVTGNLILSQYIFEESFRGGLNIKVADFFGLGYSQILIGAGASGGPRVTLFDASRNLVLLNFFAHDENLRGGVSVDAGTLLGSTAVYIVTGVGPGGPPEIAVFDGISGTEVGRFLTGEASDTRGVTVRVGDPDATTGQRQIFASPADGSGSEQAFNPLEKLDLSKIFTETPSNT
ncbi:MAG: peptidylprolyl isomerase [Bacteroidales bacterium]|nr:peptidylprolyl isomerase [Bacteroidales bacterium]